MEENHRARRLGKTLMFFESDEHRNIYCRFYDQCLWAAAVENWRSFSCKWCDLKKEEEGWRGKRVERIH